MRRWILTLLYSAFAAEIAAAAATSPALCVRSIHVHAPTMAVDESRLTLDAANLPPGASWLWLRGRRMQAALSRLPWVRESHVYRAFPAAVEVSVGLRATAGLVLLRGLLHEVDADGVIIRRAKSAPNSGIPVIALPPTASSRVGIAPNSAAVRAALQIHRSLSLKCATNVAKIVVDENNNLCLNMHDGLACKFGEADDLELKTRELTRIYYREPGIGRRVREIDLSVPSMPACILRASSAAPPLQQPQGKPIQHTEPAAD